MSIEVRREDGFTYVTYAEGKRPLKIAVYDVAGDFSRYDNLFRMITEITQIANAPEHIKKMEPPNYYALVERLATMVCKSFSPTTNWGVTKPEVRGVVVFTLLAGMEAGRWPDEYPTGPSFFVQDNGGGGYE